MKSKYVSALRVDRVLALRRFGLAWNMRPPGSSAQSHYGAQGWQKVGICAKRGGAWLRTQRAAVLLCVGEVPRFVTFQKSQYQTGWHKIGE